LGDQGASACGGGVSLARRANNQAKAKRGAADDVPNNWRGGFSCSLRVLAQCSFMTNPAGFITDFGLTFINVRFYPYKHGFHAREIL